MKDILELLSVGEGCNKEGWGRDALCETSAIPQWSVIGGQP